MHTKRTLLKNAKLYLILDGDVNTFDELFEILKQSVDAGIDIVQLRAKHASDVEIVEFTKKAITFINGRILFILNDRVDLAMDTNCDGVHLGQEDMSIAQARRLVGKEMMIGVSCQTREHATRAGAAGADYIGFGSVFKTLTKPDRAVMDLEILRDVVKQTNTPVFAIGGITLENVDSLIDIGVKRIAVCRCICQAGDIKTTGKEFLKKLARIIQWQNVSFPS